MGRRARTRQANEEREEEEDEEREEEEDEEEGEDDGQQLSQDDTEADPVCGLYAGGEAPQSAIDVDATKTVGEQLEEQKNEEEAGSYADQTTHAIATGGSDCDDDDYDTEDGGQGEGLTRIDAHGNKIKTGTRLLTALEVLDSDSGVEDEVTMKRPSVSRQFKMIAEGVKRAAAAGKMAPDPSPRRMRAPKRRARPAASVLVPDEFGADSLIFDERDGDGVTNLSDDEDDEDDSVYDIEEIMAREWDTERQEMMWTVKFTGWGPEFNEVRTCGVQYNMGRMYSCST